MDCRNKSRPVHQLAGTTKRGALYSARRVPRKKPGEGHLFTRLECAGERAGFDLIHFAATFMNHSGR